MKIEQIHHQDPGTGVPPAFLQCDERWGDKIYAPGGTLTFCKAGCLMCCVTSLAAWAGYHIEPVEVATTLGKAGAFSGNLLTHYAKVSEAFPLLQWKGREDWRQVPADLELLRASLRQWPVIVELDYEPSDIDVDQHFVLAIRYQSDPDGGLNDSLLIMDPMQGYTSISDYFNPDWIAWCRRKKITKVQRILTGARVFEVV